MTDWMPSMAERCLHNLSFRIEEIEIKLHRLMWVVMTNPWPSFNDCLPKLPLKLGHEWVITIHNCIWMKIVSHVCAGLANNLITQALFVTYNKCNYAEMLYMTYNLGRNVVNEPNQNFWKVLLKKHNLFNCLKMQGIVALPHVRRIKWWRRALSKACMLINLLGI